jgi:hypothetical protein
MLARVIVVFGLAQFGVTAVAAPVPKAVHAVPLYFPTTVGAKWVYETPNGQIETAVVSAVEKDGDDLIVSREGADGTRTAYAKVIVSPDGLRQEREATGGKVGWVLKSTVNAGDSWDMPEGGTRTVFGPEEVEVPAGKFHALRVEYEQFGAKYTSWYAPNVGEVKRVMKRDQAETVPRALKAFKWPDAKK